MRPLNYAILKYMTTVDKASAKEVVDALKPEYGSFRMLNMLTVQEALMTAEQNTLLEEAGYNLNEQGDDVDIFFKITSYGEMMIDKYVK